MLVAARKPSTRRSYAAKWRSFLRFVEEHPLQPGQSPITQVLLFLNDLFRKGLKPQSLKVYLAALSAHMPKVDGCTVFSHPLSRQFLKGSMNLAPPVSRPPPSWSLSVVLKSLLGAPFEPMATTDLRLLTWKTVLLVAVTSARRASELCALRMDPPYLAFHKDKVVLRPDPSFLPKVVSEFHVNQDIVLPAFFQSPSTPLERKLHALDVRRALAFYKDRTADVRRSPRLFVCYAGPNAGKPVSSQRLASWIVSAIELAYQLQNLTLDAPVRAHSTSAISTSTAFQRGTSVTDICRAATWSSPSTFVKHYRLDTRARADCAFGRTVLSAIL